MKTKTVLLSAAFLLSFAPAAAAQFPILIGKVPPADDNQKPTVAPAIDYGGMRIMLPDYFKVGDVTGKIGGAKAVTLVKPVYRDEAKEAGAEGKVKIEVEIDESGTVTSAKAVEGNPLLFEAAQNAARSSKFLTPKTGEARTKVSGYLIYNFVIDKPNWFAAVFGLWRNNYGISPAVTKKAFGADWTEENELIDKLTEIRRREPKDAVPRFERQTVLTSSGATGSTMRVTGRIIPPPPPDAEGVATAQKLIEILQTRLAADPAAHWQFNLNLDLMQAASRYRVPGGRADALAILRQRAQNAPAGAPPEVLAELKKLIDFLDKADRATDTEREIRKTIRVLASVGNEN